MPFFSCRLIATRRGNLEKKLDLGDHTMDRINACITNRKPALLALLLVDVLKDNGWSPDDVHFLGSEIINESGILQ